MAHSSSNQASVPDAQIPDTEVIINNTEFEHVPKKHKDLDFVNVWLNENVTVQSEIWRGEKLREKKPTYDTEYEYYVPNDNIFGPCCPRRIRKGYHNHINKTSSCPSRSTRRRQTSPASTHLTLNRISRKIQTQMKKREVCPLRIAELAVPTKRQCIETWRCKSNVLPGFMVERLKQHVLDQTPIVKIPEAIYCFERGRHRSSKKWLPRKTNHNESLQLSNQMAMRMLSIVFAHKIANKLLNPANITLNSDLEKLSKIVSNDIAEIMPQRQCNFRRNERFQAIHKDVTNKITVWIAGILDDLSLKLLEEELRVKMESEAQIDAMLEFSEQFYSIAETIIQHENNLLFDPPIKSKELEEEEGPVLDIIDDIIDNVVNVCEPLQLQFELASDSSKISKDASLEEERDQPLTAIESSDNKLSKLEEIFNTEEALQDSSGTDNSLAASQEELTNSEHFRNEIVGIIDNIAKELGNDIENEQISPMSETEDINDGRDDQITLESQIEHDINGGKIENILPKEEVIHYIEDGQNKPVSPEAEMELDIDDGSTEKVSYQTEMDQDTQEEKISPGAGTESDINDRNINPIDENSLNVEKKSDTFDKTDSNVSEDSEIFTDDSLDDMNSNKVLFPKSDLVNPDYNTGHFIMSTTEETESDERLQVSWNPTTDKFKIVFAEPNVNLLSDADESWPTNLSDPMIKITASISKSMSSLHKIIEKDEKQTSSDEEDKAGQITEDDMSLTKKHDTTYESNVDENQMLSDEKVEAGQITEDDMSPTKKHDTTYELNVDENQMLSDEEDEADQVTEDDMSPTKKHDTTNESSKRTPKLYTMTITSEPKTRATQDNSKLIEVNDINKTINVPKTFVSDVNSDNELSKPKNHQMDSGESNYIRAETTSDRTEDDAPTSQKRKIHTGYDWKVRPKTAPSWVPSWGQGRGEPSEDSSVKLKSPSMVTEYELQEWCKELEKAFVNLEIWSKWINTTCKESLIMLRQREFRCPCLAQKSAINWMRHKRDVRKDALLWSKLYQHTQNNFRSLKKKYSNIEYSSITPSAISNKTVFDVICDFENDSIELHQMIVKAEYRAVCTCNKTKTTNHK